MNNGTVAVLGSTSLTGKFILKQLVLANYDVVAFSREPYTDEAGIYWKKLPSEALSNSSSPSDFPVLPFWICAAPIWVLPSYFTMLESRGVRRIVILSSTSLYTKARSESTDERAVAAQLEKAELDIKGWAEKNGVEWVVLRPTLIYGQGLDKNISEIARVIRRFGFFPLLGKASGLRQPIHASKVALACIAALLKRTIINRSYNISGGEILSYRTMIERIFFALNRPVWFFPIPLFTFRIAVRIMRLFPRYRHWTVSMTERMNTDLVFDHSDAVKDFNFEPGTFFLEVDDIVNQNVDV